MTASAANATPPTVNALLTVASKLVKSPLVTTRPLVDPPPKVTESDPIPWIVVEIPPAIVTVLVLLS